MFLVEDGEICVKLEDNITTRYSCRGDVNPVSGLRFWERLARLRGAATGPGSRWDSDSGLATWLHVHRLIGEGLLWNRSLLTMLRFFP